MFCELFGKAEGYCRDKVAEFVDDAHEGMFEFLETQYISVSW